MVIKSFICVLFLNLWQAKQIIGVPAGIKVQEISDERLDMYFRKCIKKVQKISPSMHIVHKHMNPHSTAVALENSKHSFEICPKF